MAEARLARLRRAPEKLMVPRPLPDHDGWFAVDATWGEVQPIELAPGLETIAELELIHHLEADSDIVDCRPADAFAKETIPGARNIPWEEIHARRAELDGTRPTVLFCNGPQCLATARAVAALLGSGHPVGTLVYYRGGLHDWLTLGYPTTQPSRGGPAA